MTRIAIVVATLALAGAVSGAEAAVAPSLHARGSAACTQWKKVHGKRVCVRRAPTLAPSKRGHYEGATDQNAALRFDVAVVSGKVALRAIAIPELDETCTPGGGVIAFTVSFGAFALHPDAKGHIHASFSFDRNGGGRGTFTLDGTVDAAGRGSGTLTDGESLNANGVTLSCTTGKVARRAGMGTAAVHPAARPKPGHYRGTTSQGAQIDFDLTDVGGILYAQALSFVEIDETCTPGQVSVAIYSVSFGSTLILVDGHGRLHFVYQQLASSTLDPAARTFTLDGTFDGSGHVSGTVSDQSVVEEPTGNLSCVSGPVTWSANA